jgi:hypothetical protein
VRDARSIVGELGKFSEDLLTKSRWLVLNKRDLLPDDEAVQRAVSIAVALKYRGPAFLISGVTHAGTADLTEAVMRFLETGEAPAQGNLPLPVIRAAKPAKAARVPAKRRPAAKKHARQKSVRRRRNRHPGKRRRSADERHPQTKKPALAGFFVLRAERRRSLDRCLLHRLDAGGQGALVARGLVAMNDVLVDQRIDDRLGIFQAVLASVLLPAATASTTLRRAERMRERSATLRLRLVSARRALFRPTWYSPRKNLQESGSFEGRVV